MSETRPPGPGHETQDLSLRPLVLAGLTLLAILVLLGPAGALLLRHYAAREAETSPPPISLVGPDVPPAPRLQVQPRKDLQTLRAEENAVLDGYGWVDPQAGIARIPIARAMTLLAERRAGEGRR